MHIKTTWENMKLKQKILSVFLPVNIISLVVILIVSIVILINNEKKEVLDVANDKLNLVTEQTDKIISNVKYNIKAFSTSSALQNAIKTSYPQNEYGNYLFSSAIHSAIYNIMNIQNYITSGYIQTYDNRVYDFSTNNIYVPTLEMERRYSEITSRKGKIIIDSAMTDTENSAICISKSLIDINTGECLGVLSFDINESLFKDIYINVSNPNNERFLIINDNTIISSSNTAEIHTNFNNFKNNYMDNNKNDLILSKKTKSSDLTVYYFSNYYNIYKHVFNLAYSLIALGLIIILLIIFLSNMLAKSIVKPITELASFANECGHGNFNTPLNIKSNDEIGFLQKSFLDMNNNIQDLTSKIYYEQAEKKEFELKLLQAQINPHFLYNCLENICYLISDNNQQCAISMTYHLGNYYRSILSKGRNIITIQEELNLIKDYLEIQLIKSPNLFSYEIKVSENLLQLKILKMILQPIAENAVLHGFCHSINNGKILIHGWECYDNIYISITDNGIGISPDKITSIWKNSNTTFPKHFGLKNIHDRLQLKYGKDYGITIRSIENYETTITVKFPKKI